MAVEINDLEYQVDYLLRLLQLMKSENKALNKKLEMVRQEYSQLAEKNSRAVDKIKTVITRLKETAA